MSRSESMYQSLSIKHKIIINFLCVGVIPLIILSLVIYLMLQRSLPLGQVYSTMMLVTLLDLIIVFIMGRNFGLRYSIPIIRASQHLNLMAEGDFSIPVSKRALAQQDELGVIANSLENINANISKLIQEVKQSSGELNCTLEHIAVNTENISDGAKQQAASFEQISCAVQTNAENAQSANHLAQNIEQNAKKAESAMSSTLEAMATIENIFTQIVEAVNFMYGDRGSNEFIGVKCRD